MQRTYLFVLLFSSMVLLISCDPCANLDCVTDNHYGQFRIVSRTDGRDLVFGPTAIYDKTKIKFYSLAGTDTTFFDYSTVKMPGAGYDSILYVRFFPATTTPVYLRFNTADTDTLLVTYNTYQTKCCGIITNITRFRYNNAVDIPGDQGTQEIRK